MSMQRLVVQSPALPFAAPDRGWGHLVGAPAGSSRVGFCRRGPRQPPADPHLYHVLASHDHAGLPNRRTTWQAAHKSQKIGFCVRGEDRPKLGNNIGRWRCPRRRLGWKRGPRRDPCRKIGKTGSQATPSQKDRSTNASPETPCPGITAVEICDFATTRLEAPSERLGYFSGPPARPHASAGAPLSIVPLDRPVFLIFCIAPDANARGPKGHRGARNRLARHCHAARHCLVHNTPRISLVDDQASLALMLGARREPSWVRRRPFASQLRPQMARRGRTSDSRS